MLIIAQGIQITMMVHNNNNNNKRELIIKIVIAYLCALTMLILYFKFFSGHGKGRLGGHIEKSWQSVFSSIQYYIFGAIALCYPYFYISYKDYKKKQSGNSSSSVKDKE